MSNTNIAAQLKKIATAVKYIEFGKKSVYRKLFFLIQFYVPFKIISAHIRWANQ